LKQTFSLFQNPPSVHWHWWFHPSRHWAG